MAEKKFGNAFKGPLSVRFPELIKDWDFEKNKLHPDEYTITSRESVYWICPKEGHSWKTRIGRRVYENRTCSVCNKLNANKPKTYSESFAGKYPEYLKYWDYEKNEIGPDEIKPKSTKKVWMICEKKHSYEAPVNGISRGRGCSYCSGKKIGYGNDFKSHYPKQSSEWDYENNLKGPENYTKSSTYRANWICKNDKRHRWSQTLNARSRGVGCPYCTNQKIGFGNDLESKFPNVAKYWDKNKNSKLASEVFPASNKKAWWLCENNHSHYVVIAHKVARRNAKTKGCAYCANQKTGFGNDLKTLFPEIAAEWDYQTNKKGPEFYTPQSAARVFWICPKNENHKFKTEIRSRTPGSYHKGKIREKGSGCPYCAGQKVGFGNDLKTLFPEIAAEWDYQKNSDLPDEVRPQSHKKKWWICPVGHSYESSIAHRTPAMSGKIYKGNIPVGCPYCKLTPRSKDELYLLFELKLFFKIEEGDNKIKLNKIRDVDIKIPDLKIVIEYDGSYWHKDRLEIDKEKTKLLRQKGWTVIRVREKPLKIISKKYNVHSEFSDYKNTANSVLRKLKQLGYLKEDINDYLKKEHLVNKKEADKHMKQLLKDKASGS